MSSPLLYLVAGGGITALCGMRDWLVIVGASPAFLPFMLCVISMAAIGLYAEADDYRRAAGRAEAYRVRGDNYFDKWYALHNQVQAEHDADAALDRESEAWKEGQTFRPMGVANMVQDFAQSYPNRVQHSPIWRTIHGASKAIVVENLLWQSRPETGERE